MSFNSEPKDKSSDLSQFKVFADDKNRVTRKLKFVVGMLENIVGKRENAERQHFFSFSRNVFKKVIMTRGSLQVGIVW